MSRFSKLQRFLAFDTDSHKRVVAKRQECSQRIKELMKKKRDLLNSSSDVSQNIAEIEIEIGGLCEFLRKTRAFSLVRKRNTCLLTGRTRGYKRRFKMSRYQIRFYACLGKIVGLRKV